MSLLQAGFGSSGGDYTIDDSLRFRASATAYLDRTPASSGDRRTWTWSGWVKRSYFPGATIFRIQLWFNIQSRTMELT
jgi:hypothetical protein